MNKPTLCLLVLTCALFAGCKKTTRSISHCGYPQQSSYRGDGTRDDASDLVFEYRGELSEFDVLGIPRGEITSEADIRRALEKSKRVNPRPAPRRGAADQKQVERLKRLAYEASVAELVQGYN